jgi:hypothetical protein
MFARHGILARCQSQRVAELVVRILSGESVPRAQPTDGAFESKEYLPGRWGVIYRDRAGEEYDVASLDRDRELADALAAALGDEDASEALRIDAAWQAWQRECDLADLRGDELARALLAAYVSCLSAQGRRAELETVYRGVGFSHHPLAEEFSRAQERIASALCHGAAGILEELRAGIEAEQVAE